MTLLPSSTATQSPELVPCYLCGKPTMPRMFRVANDPPFAICPLAEAMACLERAEARTAAQRAGAAAGTGQDGAPLARPRPSQARKTLLGTTR